MFILMHELCFGVKLRLRIQAVGLHYFHEIQSVKSYSARSRWKMSKRSTMNINMRMGVKTWYVVQTYRHDNVTDMERKKFHWAHGKQHHSLLPEKYLIGLKNMKKDWSGPIKFSKIW